MRHNGCRNQAFTHFDLNERYRDVSTVGLEFRVVILNNDAWAWTRRRWWLVSTFICEAGVTGGQARWSKLRLTAWRCKLA